MYVGGLGPPFSEIPVPPSLWTAVLQQGFVGCFMDLVMNNEAVDVAAYAREQDSGRTLSHALILFVSARSERVFPAKNFEFTHKEHGLRRWFNNTFIQMTK